ncbi:MAG: hypothetical protein V4594_17810 [Bacteroidota bacterium]
MMCIKNNKTHLALLVLLSLLVSSCKDFFEPSLENRTVQLNAPANGTESNKYQVGFWWEPVTDALSYRLQIATPDFSAPASLVKDTLITSATSYTLTMEPGKYAWRVRAENGSSNSKYFSAAFVIHESSLKEQKLSLKTPGSGYLSNTTQVALSWDLLYGAAEYQLQIDTMNFADESKLVFSQSFSTDKFTYSFPKDGIYQWRVRAANDKETSKWSETRLMTFDKTAPAKPEISAPADGAVLPMPVLLSWKSVPTAKKYKLYVYKSNGTTSYDASFPLTLTTNSYSFNLGQQQNEVVFWKVMAIDEIGNEGPFSELRSFVIQ